MEIKDYLLPSNKENNKSAEKPVAKADETKKYYHSKFAPSSQGTKSRKPIEDDFKITM